MKFRKAHWRLAATVIAVLLALSAVSALAAEPSEPTIWDTSRTGSLTLIKNSEDDYLASEPGLSQAEIAAYLQQHPDELTPEPGVVFRYLKVADIAQYTQDNVVKIGYALTDDAAEFLGLDDDVPYYDASLLDKKLLGKTASETERFMDQTDAASMPETDEDGTTTVSDLDLGLYLVCEYTYRGTSIADGDHCAPFFVSLPSTDRDEDGNNSWVYDLTLAPKNQIEQLRNDLVIVDPSGCETKEYDAEMDDPTQYLIRSDVPNAVGKLQTYQIKDVLAPGITYEPETALVYGVTDEGERTALVDGTDYTVSGQQELIFDFTPASLADDEGWSKYDSVEIYYKAHLNKDAVIGGEGNPTMVYTVYSKYANTAGTDVLETLPVHVPVRVFTYAINVHKIGADTKAGLAGVVFELQDADGSRIPVAQDEKGYYLSTDGNATLTTDQNGDILVRGVEAADYYLKEVSTNKLYNLLGDKVKIEITSNELDYYPSDSGTIVQADRTAVYYTDNYPRYNYYLLPVLYATEDVVPDGTYVCAGTPTLRTVSDGQKQVMYDMAALEWSCNYTMGSRTANSVDSGVVKLEITNTPVPRSPKTGDSSHVLLAVGAFCAACATTIILRRKNKHEKEAE